MALRSALKSKTPPGEPVRSEALYTTLDRLEAKGFVTTDAWANRRQNVVGDPSASYA
jgi:DNA-binding PadR family transcriptional regulator